MTERPLLTKKSSFPKKNYQTKSEFIGGIGLTEDNRILIEVKRKGNRILEISKPYICTISASSMESAISQIKKIARKRYNDYFFSNSTWNNQNVPIIMKGVELIEKPNWLLKIKTKAPFQKNKVKIRKYNNGSLYWRKHRKR